MSGSWLARVKALRRRKAASVDRNEQDARRRNYAEIFVALSKAKQQYTEVALHARELESLGCEVTRPNFAGVAQRLEQELAVDVGKVQLNSFNFSFQDQLDKWKKPLSQARNGIVQQYGGAGLDEPVLKILESKPEYEEAVRRIRSRATRRKELIRNDSRGVLSKLQQLHESDIEDVESLAPGAASDEWKRGLSNLVSKGLSWRELESGPLRDWLENSGLLQFCKVRLS